MVSRILTIGRPSLVGLVTLLWMAMASADTLRVELATSDLRRIHKNLPVGYPDGARTLESSYLHLLVILFEFDSLRHLLGNEPAREVMQFWSEDHYRELYKIVLEDHGRIRGLAGRHGFSCCPPEGPQ